MMKPYKPLLSRRYLLKHGSSSLVASLAAGSLSRVWAQPTRPLEVASAGSVRAILEGPLTAAAAQLLQLNLRCHAQGADAVAHALADGSLHADVFIPITPGPMQTVMQAGKAEIAYPIARTEMVLLYSPNSRFTAQFAAAAAQKASWWDVLQEPGLRFAHGNPAGDPGGRNAFFLLMLAARKFGHPKLVDTLLGSGQTPPSPTPGVSTLQKLETGELDAAASYRVSTSFTKLPYLVLPDDINLSGDHVAAEHPDLRLSIDGRTFSPEPLVFYAAVLTNAAHQRSAVTFVDWLRSNTAQALLQKYQYAAPGAAPILRG